MNGDSDGYFLAEPLWTDPWSNRLELVHASLFPLIKKRKKKKKENRKEKKKACKWGMIRRTFPHASRMRGIGHTLVSRSAVFHFDDS